MSRAVVYETFGGPEVLEVRDVPESHAGPGEVRVRVTAAGLNPMDWKISSNPETAARFGVTVPSGFGCDFAGVVDEVGAGVDGFATVPSGFGCDFAGVVDEVGAGVDGFAVDDRVYGGAMAKAVAEFLVMKVPAAAPDMLFPTPDGIVDEVASTLPVAGLTAAAALEAIGLRSGDTVLVGGAAGGVGVFAVQLARLADGAVRPDRPILSGSPM
ncbi:alcohol dehydrogenase catalytic domain-containing protein [Actinoallomurus soli]|uniref:alcohol dehydrogenase catalytic domain-containing protein n=1 Tax=Actinoallomurus soli TaxID=2952535 RepID=UPI00209344B7|nr:alcohol dehydrogenase catalytic domain-containing protein [Actinoallomurus soli]